MLQTEHLVTGYKKGSRSIVVTRNINIGVKEGMLCCILGPNGIGKSTLLKTLSGLLPPLSGTITINKKSLSHYNAGELARNIALVLTDPLALGTLDVYTLVSMGRIPHTGAFGKLNAGDKQHIHDSLSLIGISDFKHKRFMELSDGEKQKVQISRALCQDPKLLILDEPTAFLDLTGRIDILWMLKDLARQTKRSILVSTHELDLALRLSDSVLLMDKNGDLHQGAPEDLLLKGTLQKVFKGENFDFHPDTGELRFHSMLTDRVELEAPEDLYPWTLRALNRLGLAVTDKKRGLFKVKAQRNEGKPVWQLYHNNTENRFNSLFELGQFYQQEFK